MQGLPHVVVAPRGGHVQAGPQGEVPHPHEGDRGFHADACPYEVEEGAVWEPVGHEHPAGGRGEEDGVVEHPVEGLPAQGHL